MAELNQAIEAAGTLATKASATAYTAGFSSTLIGFISQVDWMQLGGVIAVVGTFLVNWYYKHKYYKLEELKAKNDIDKNKRQAR